MQAPPPAAPPARMYCRSPPPLAGEPRFVRAAAVPSRPGRLQAQPARALRPCQPQSQPAAAVHTHTRSPLPPFPSPALQVHVCDGIKFVQDAPEGHYDIIVVDSSDPVGPAEVLFQKVGGPGRFPFHGLMAGLVLSLLWLDGVVSGTPVCSSRQWGGAASGASSWRGHMPPWLVGTVAGAAVLVLVVSGAVFLAAFEQAASCVPMGAWCWRVLCHGFRHGGEEVQPQGVASKPPAQGTEQRRGRDGQLGGLFGPLFPFTLRPTCFPACPHPPASMPCPTCSPSLRPCTARWRPAALCARRQAPARRGARMLPGHEA